ncbi:MAG TPA: DUF1592 domain-containing protein [Labilithrix sp.]|nr:DUF1592 domain-containing protein [Labilithrix sp.]
MKRVSLTPAMLVLAAAAVGGCSSDEPAAEPAPVVGPAPLRRLSNSEYLNALHDLFPGQAPALPILPNDTASSGFENASEAQQPSDVRVARYEAIASLYAEGATRDLAAVRALTGCADWATPSQASACATSFIEAAGSRVFRRPLSLEERDRFTLRFQAWSSAIDFEAAVRLTVSAMLQSPQFLYRAEPPPPPEGEGSKVVPVEPFAMASRLSFFLWESVPDGDLLGAASRDELRSAEQIRAQAERMLRDERARRVLWSFHRQWLGLDRILGEEHLVRTPQVDPSWTAASPLAAAAESRLFVENVLMEGGTLRDLLLSRRAWVNGEMARLYGAQPPADPAAWHEVMLPEGQRAGILTRSAFLAGYSHRGATSPPIRGNGIELHLLCQLPISPPPGVDLSMPKAAPNDGPKTNRMLFETRTAPPACQGCHLGLNGFGFGFESYDAAGAFQTREQGLPIDARGRVVGTDVDRPFDGAVDLSTALEGSDVVRACVTRQWMTYALGRAPVADELPLTAALARGFKDSGGDIRALLIDIVTTPTFRLRRIGGS